MPLLPIAIAAAWQKRCKQALWLAGVLSVLFGVGAMAQEISLHGQHAVTVDGDDPFFADPAYDDSAWTRIAVPSSLRAAGIDGRTDVFWYRITFTVPNSWEVPSPAIRLGVLTRADETYLNGVKIGGMGTVGPRHSDWHSFPPTTPRLYPFDPDLLRIGENNILAIRGAREPYIDDGGIIEGPVSLVSLPVVLDDALTRQSQFVSFRYLFFGIETMILLGMIVAVLLGVRSQFLFLFQLFYIPAYLFSLEWRGVLALMGIDGPGIQSVANICGALALPGLIEFTAHVLNHKVGRLGRTIQVLSVLSLISIPASDGPILQWWTMESHLVWHSLMLVGLLTIATWAAWAVVRGTPYAIPVCGGLLCIFGGIAVDITLPLNFFEREFGFRIGEVGVLCLYLSLAFVVLRNITDRETDLRAANVYISQMHEEERARMARDVHDGIGQWLSTIKVKVDLLRAWERPVPDQSPGLLDGLSNDVRGAIEDVRRVSHDLAPALLEERGLIGAMRAHVEGIRASGSVAVTLDAPGRVELDQSATTHVFRIFQEVIANALRHSDCRSIRVVIDRTTTQFRMEIADDGQGFDTRQPTGPFALGIKSMQSRAKILKATLELDSAIGRGTKMTLALKCAKPAEPSQ